MAVRLSALRAGRALPPRIFLVLISVKRLSRPQGHIAAGRIRSIEKNPMTSSGLERATCKFLNCIQSTEGMKRKKYPRGALLEVSLSTYARLWLLVPIGFWVRASKHTPTQVLFFIYVIVMFCVFQNDTMRMLYAYHSDDPASRPGSKLGTLSYHGPIKRGFRSLYLMERVNLEEPLPRDLLIWDLRNPVVSNIRYVPCLLCNPLRKVNFTSVCIIVIWFYKLGLQNLHY
jgi:hypothetical protein